MRYAPKGNWFIRATNIKSGKSFVPFYDGFKTKREAQEMCNKLNAATPNVSHEVMKK